MRYVIVEIMVNQSTMIRRVKSSISVFIFEDSSHAIIDEVMLEFDVKDSVCGKNELSNLRSIPTKKSVNIDIKNVDLYRQKSRAIPT